MPSGRAARAEQRDAAPARPAFVLHEHQQPWHHFDLSLEENGVLRSWALSRGMPITSEHDKLAVADHDLDHLTYEDADKSIADTGWWEDSDRNARRMIFILHGKDGARRYALIHTDRDWLLHLTCDQP
ncbi:MAG: DNA polymerase ligase N-terminal domain-containing protein [Nocardioidaceae bacterium]